MEQKLIQITGLIIECINRLKEEQTLEVPPTLDYATPLFGNDGFLDSMSLVTLVVMLEQELEDKFEVEVSIADASALSQNRSPFGTIGALAEFSNEQLSHA